MARTFALFSILSVAAVSLAGPAGAQELTLGQSQATYPRLVDTSGIDPNTFVVGHPASVHTRAGHANFDHPAVNAQGAPAEIDANTFIPRHPAGPASIDGTDDARVAQAGR